MIFFHQIFTENFFKRIFLQGRTLRQCLFIKITTISLIGFLGVVSISFAEPAVEKLEKQIILVQKELKKQKKYIDRLQNVAGEQFQKLDELEQTLPPQDLLDSLQNALLEMQLKIKHLDDKINIINKKLLTQTTVEGNNQQQTKESNSNQSQLALGLLALQAGNPNDAVNLLQGILNGNSEDSVKESVLMSLGKSFLSQNYYKQAASYFGAILRDFPDSIHVPAAFYYLGQTLGSLGEKEQQKILWNEMQKNYPEHFLSKRLLAK